MLEDEQRGGESYCDCTEKKVDNLFKLTPQKYL